MNPGLLSMAQQFSGLPMGALIGGPLKAAAQANSMMAMTFTEFMLDTCFTLIPVKDAAAIQGQLEVRDPKTGVITKRAIPSTPAIGAHDEYRPIMIVMSLTRAVLTPGLPATPGTPGDPNAKPAVPSTAGTPPTPAIIQDFTTQFNLPLLTIMPLNSLAVETVDVGFEMEVKSSFAKETSDESVKEGKAQVSFAAKAQIGPFSVSIKGSASYSSKDTSSVKTQYKKENSAKYTVNVHAGQLPLPAGVPVILEAFASAIQPITLN